ncbi:MAG: iron chelate uptake ABC transporter family permease subunit, partial [Desulfovibrionaceae bacterium]|nr:iron chelate uptake ABC transporter family permease subunit [Desulfovibrionaceae bacterium]
MEKKQHCPKVNSSRTSWCFWLALLAVGLLAVFFSLWAGAAPIAPRDIVVALLGKGEPLAQTIVWQIRLPRITLALVTGACLGASGCAFQAVLRNPLADPYLLGVSGGGALAGVGALL